jgi:hypothetical protein
MAAYVPPEKRDIMPSLRRSEEQKRGWRISDAEVPLSVLFRWGLKVTFVYVVFSSILWVFRNALLTMWATNAMKHIMEGSGR